MENRLLTLPYELLILILGFAHGREKWLLYQAIKDDVEWDSSVVDQFKTILVWVVTGHDYIQNPRDCIFWTWNTPEFDHENDHVFDHDIINKDGSLGITINRITDFTYRTNMCYTVLHRINWPKTLFYGIRIVTIEDYEGFDPFDSLKWMPRFEGDDDDSFEIMEFEGPEQTLMVIHNTVPDFSSFQSASEEIDDYEAWVLNRSDLDVDMTFGYKEVTVVDDDFSRTIHYYLNFMAVMEHFEMMSDEEYNTKYRND